jgi:hypothetical protein
MSRKNVTHGYCTNCGAWSEDCETVIVYGAPEKTCKKCRLSL